MTTSTKQTAQHTPGPWHIHGTKWTPLASVRSSTGKAITLFSWICIRSIGHDQAAANARLIAAAPDLLEAVKIARQSLAGSVSPSAVRNSSIRAEVAIFDAAIAKAEGRT